MKTTILLALILLAGCKDKSGGGSIPDGTDSHQSKSASVDRDGFPIVEAKISKLVQPITVDDVRIIITRIVVGPAEVKGLGRSFMTDNSYLIVWIQIENVSKDRKIDYRPLSESIADSKLTDQIGNTYQIGAWHRHVDSSGYDSIYPGKAALDAAMFEPPVAAAKEFTLTLPMERALGIKKSLKITFPAGLIEKK